LLQAWRSGGGRTFASYSSLARAESISYGSAAGAYDGQGQDFDGDEVVSFDYATPRRARLFRETVGMPERYVLEIE